MIYDKGGTEEPRMNDPECLNAEVLQASLLDIRCLH